METTCCIAGGGPAGMVLGWLLARAGVRVAVLEKHTDFLRDFRGDTIHPSTLEIMHEAGVLEEFLRRPHQEVHQVRALMGDDEMVIADFSRLSARCPFVILMPQWDFLDFVAQRAASFPTFELHMGAEVTGLLEDGGRVGGVRARIDGAEREIRSDLVVGCDGRSSAVRAAAELPVETFGSSIDVLWMRIPKDSTETDFFFRFRHGTALITLDRDDYWQCGYAILKGGFDDIRAEGIGAFRARIAEMAPSLSGRLDALRSWDDVSLLTVRVDRLKRWCKPGLLCIGDAAHAMSPVGGVGINLAVQDAVATANHLAAPLREGRATLADLEQIQKRRAFPTRVTQRIQLVMQTLQQRGGRTGMPLPMKLAELTRIPRHVRARLIGIGVRPEHLLA